MENTRFLQFLTKSLSEKTPKVGETLTLPSHQRYLLALTGSTLAEIRKNATTLDDDRQKIEKQLSELSFQEYRSFIASHDAVSVVGSSIAEIVQALNAITEFLPVLEDNAKGLSKGLGLSSLSEGSFALERKNVGVLASSYSELAELLSIPLLMDSFVVDGNFDAAMDLRDHVEHLGIRFSGSSIVKDVILPSVRANVDKVADRLSMSLKGELSLASCIKLTGHLRRLNVMSEDRLSILFLLSRQEYMRNVVMNDSLKNYIESVRTHLTEIITQYQAIFSDNYANSILSSFMLRFMDEFLGAIVERLDGVEDFTEISQLSTQLMHFGVALGRKGFDFRYLIVRIFEDKLRHSTEKLVTESMTNLSKSLLYFSPSQWKSKDAKVSESMPNSLLNYPVLAVTTNGILGAFNNIRSIPALSNCVPLYRLLLQHLKQFKKDLDARIEKVEDQDKEAMLKDVRTFTTTEWIPYLCKCVQNDLYPESMPLFEFRSLEISN